MVPQFPSKGAEMPLADAVGIGVELACRRGELKKWRRLTDAQSNLCRQVLLPVKLRPGGARHECH